MFTKIKQHKIALQIARAHNLELCYKEARKQGYSPKEALEEFDMLTPNAMTQLDACKHAHRK